MQGAHPTLLVVRCTEISSEEISLSTTPPRGMEIRPRLKAMYVNYLLSGVQGQQQCKRIPQCTCLGGWHGCKLLVTKDTWPDSDDLSGAEG